MKSIAVVSFGLLLLTSVAGAKPPTDADIKTILASSTSPAERRGAWDRLARGGPDAIVPLLHAIPVGDTATANWLRTALDQVLARTLKERLPVGELLTLARDAKAAGRARRFALEIVEEQRPGMSAKLFLDWLDDPEFRYEAVAATIDAGQANFKAGDRAGALTQFQRAFEASREIDQARLAAKSLAGLGTKVSIPEHLGCFRDWYVIGPFDARGMKGFTLRYPPEDHVDLAAELDGQKGKVRWKRLTAPELTSGRHVVLVDLRDRAALGDADDAVGFAYTELAVEREQDVEFRGAADDNFTVYVNGQRVFGFEEYRNGVRHDRHRFPVHLKAGKNRVLVKVCQTNPEPNWEFLLRAVDRTGKGIVMRSLLP
jgi:hypothetical protein